MAKRQSFADKASKKKHIMNCPVCGTPMTPTALILPVPSASGSIRFRRNIVQICKCNQKEYY